MDNKKCKKCSKILDGKKTSYCSYKCSRRHLKTLWQKRRREVVNKAKSLWRKKTKRKSDKESLNKKRARAKVHRALKTGLLKKLPCLRCKNINVQAHHPDYSKPLDIVWLCPHHHNKEHNKLSTV